MKISKSKQELARIISENGGWREGVEFSSQDKDGEVFHYATKPTINAGCEVWHHKGCIGVGEFTAETLSNWHQTILSRAEYFHLYPALGELRGKVTEENRHEPVWTNPPSIEQLAADYRNAKDYAERKQQEADAAKTDADARLKALELAGEELGLLVSPITAKQEPELVITDWRDLVVGDVIEVTGSSNEKWEKVKGKELTIKTVRSDGASTGKWLVRDNTEFRIIRHP